MKKSHSLVYLILLVVLFSHMALADSIRCGGRLVDIGDTKADVSSLCGSPEMTDTFCKPITRRTLDSTGKEVILEGCYDVDIWSYKATRGRFWKHVYFSQGRVIGIRNGERAK